MLKSMVCKLLGHNWMYRSSFTGGITYGCGRCGKTYISFCNCPSYTTSDDRELFKGLMGNQNEIKI